MSIHISFSGLKDSSAVKDHINELMQELLKITDNKYPFHLNLVRLEDELHQVVLNCTYHGKALSAKSTNSNLYKAISKAVASMKTQVIKKAQKLRNE